MATGAAANLELGERRLAAFLSPAAVGDQEKWGQMIRSRHGPRKRTSDVAQGASQHAKNSEHRDVGENLIVGVAASQTTPTAVLLVGAASLVARAMSTAAGEHASVSSQADAEHAELGCEAGELAAQPGSEYQELADVSMARGFAPTLGSAGSKSVDGA